MHSFKLNSVRDSFRCLPTKGTEWWSVVLVSTFVIGCVSSHVVAAELYAGLLKNQFGGTSLPGCILPWLLADRGIGVALIVRWPLNVVWLASVAALFAPVFVTGLLIRCSRDAIIYTLLVACLSAFTVLIIYETLRHRFLGKDWPEAASWAVVLIGAGVVASWSIRYCYREGLRRILNGKGFHDVPEGVSQALRPWAVVRYALGVTLRAMSQNEDGKER